MQSNIIRFELFARWQVPCFTGVSIYVKLNFKWLIRHRRHSKPVNPKNYSSDNESNYKPLN